MVTDSVGSVAARSVTVSSISRMSRDEHPDDLGAGAGQGGAERRRPCRSRPRRRPAARACRPRLPRGPEARRARRRVAGLRTNANGTPAASDTAAASGTPAVLGADDDSTPRSRAKRPPLAPMSRGSAGSAYALSIESGAAASGSRPSGRRPCGRAQARWRPGWRASRRVHRRRCEGAISVLVVMSMTLIGGLRGCRFVMGKRSRDPPPVAPGQVPGLLRGRRGARRLEPGHVDTGSRAAGWSVGPARAGRLTGCCASVRSGHSEVLVVRGEAGVGKTRAGVPDAARLGLHDRARGGRRVRARARVRGPASLSRRSWTRSSGSPGRSARRSARRSGCVTGTPRIRFLVGLAVLSLLSDVAEEQPADLRRDDAQWLDGATAQVLAFVARRLAAESVGLVLGAASRAASGASRGSRSSWSTGWTTGMRERCSKPPPSARRARARSDRRGGTRGNPLALLELPRGRRARRVPAGSAG